jgi:hypothetical protein
MEHPGGASTAHSSPLDHSWVARHHPKGEVISGSSAKSTLPWKLVLVALLGLLGALGWWSGVGRGSSVKATQVDPKQRRLFETWQLNPDRAIGYLQSICALGTRVSGSSGMERQQKLLADFFRKAGAEISFQEFPARHPQTGQPVAMKNLIARWNPAAKRRWLLAAHYDTRPFPDRDPKQPRGVFLGANDGASGVALMQELSHAMELLPDSVGLDMVLFDGEELIFDEAKDRDLYFLGSTHFAEQIAAGAHPRYEAGVLVDMIADKYLEIFYETNSYRFAPELVREIWKVADRLDIRAFVPRTRYEIRDDHLPLNQIAKIPVVDLIDFDYPRPSSRQPGYWHTTLDTPDKCSGESICLVGVVLLEWLKDRVATETNR